MVMVGFSALLVWAFTVDPEDAPPIWLVVMILAFFAAVGIGVIAALAQRIQEIRKGEMDDAKKY